MSRSLRNLLLIGVACLLIAIVILRITRPERHAETTAVPAATPASAMPEIPEKPLPTVAEFHGCPPEGAGGDPLLNRLKNRIDGGQYISVPFALLRQLPWPPGIENRHRRHWENGEAAQVARYEGIPVAVEGFLAGASQSGPESANCQRREREQRDVHLWLTEAPGEHRGASIVAEVTPRVREQHPAWTLSRFHEVAKSGRKVRVSGWLLLDPEHPDQVGKTRATIWEIHPIMRVETEEQGSWVPLDEPQP